MDGLAMEGKKRIHSGANIRLYLGFSWEMEVVYVNHQFQANIDSFNGNFEKIL